MKWKTRKTKQNKLFIFSIFTFLLFIFFQRHFAMVLILTLIEILLGLKKSLNTDKKNKLKIIIISHGKNLSSIILFKFS